MKRVVLIEDEQNLAFLVCEGLEEAGFQVRWERDGEAGLAAALAPEVDVVLLDGGLPKRDGFEVLALLQQQRPTLPVLMLTARILPKDAVRALQLGAVDYVRKPFSLEELIVRMERFLIGTQLEQREQEAGLHLGVLQFFPRQQRLLRPHDTVSLSYKESLLLQVLWQHEGEVMEKEALWQAVWGQEEGYASRSLDVFISRLRKLLAVEPRLQLLSIRGVGYKLVLTAAL
ncbi:winged helix family two component transcriptional regulator [Nitritalea halalkaliphila LW7]|uniref:Winged helix family two component transcriptional regulator n=1 Tax=Nitritalea halalkaliphila LW7 TaxID=1189621 RepID=I5BX08_9BACT|nr:response regulator transcription factor [Nitritalea halalkaliphila]EIM74110.1 winged helix family two component transcriptional regulator [Nitritalea halalkaliphila LW7]